MSRPRSPTSRDGRSRSPSKRSRIVSPGPAFGSAHSPSSGSRRSGRDVGLRSDSMDVDDDYYRSAGRSSRDSERDRHHRERERDYRDRERERDRDRVDRHYRRDRDRERDRDRYARSGSKDRERERDRHKDGRERTREYDRDKDRERRDKDHDKSREQARLVEKPERPRSSSKPLEEREGGSTPAAGTPEVKTPSSASEPVSEASAPTPTAPVQLVTLTAKTNAAPPVLHIKAPISLSLSTSASGTAGPRPVISAFADSDAAQKSKRLENWRQWQLEREAAKQAEEKAKQAEEKAKQLKLASPLPTDADLARKTDADRPSVPTKGWSWDDDDDDDEEEEKSTPQDDTNDDDANMADAEDGTAADAMEEDEIDPLDAFMVDVTAEVKELEKKEQKRDNRTNKSTAGSASKAGSNPSSEPITKEEEEEDLAETSEEEDILAMAAKLVKKKDIPPVDHSKVQYEPFRKNFYLEPPEMADMTPEEVHNLRLELDGIKIRGADCPKPIRKWTQAGLPSGCLQVIKHKLNYGAPTSIQSQAIPAIMSGRDVIAVAKTGSGKTIAFLLPMLRHIKDQRAIENMEGPIAIIMTPTRELAVQIHKECKNFLKVLGLRAVCAYGGSPIKDQIAELKRGAEIVVCTPGRLIDLLCANSGRVTNLRRTTFLVLDEADRMFDMGFEPQVMKIVNNVRPQRQVVLFSATFPKQMEALARKLLKRPLEITVGARSVVCEDVTQVVEVRGDDTRFPRLLEILGQVFNDNAEARVLIFVSRQEAADNLLRDLIRRGYVSQSIHGGKDQVDRDSAITDFKSGACQILIATSVAARGLDVKKLGNVINFDCPNHMEDYVHRVGRTGRAGNKGIAYTFITPEQERFAPDIAKALTNSSTPIPPELQALVDSFQEKVKSGDAKHTASGFGGKGLEKFEKERDKVLAIQKKTYGADDDEGSDDGGEGKELELEVKQVAPGITAAKAAAAANASNNANANTAAGNNANNTNNNNNNATEAAAETDANKTNGTPGASAPGSMSDALRLAKEAADRLNQSLGGAAKQRALEVAQNLNKARLDVAGDTNGGTGPTGPGSSGPGSGGPGSNVSSRDSGFALEIEINDYPTKARLMVTQKMMISQISEHSGAAITTRGVFVEKGKQPPAGERKLYLFVEGDSQYVIDKAKNEIRRILREETIKAEEAGARGGSGGTGRPAGRYQI